MLISSHHGVSLNCLNITATTAIRIGYISVFAGSVQTCSGRRKLGVGVVVSPPFYARTHVRNNKYDARLERPSLSNLWPRSWSIIASPFRERAREGNIFRSASFHSHTTTIFSRVNHTALPEISHLLFGLNVGKVQLKMPLPSSSHQLDQLETRDPPLWTRTAASYRASRILRLLKSYRIFHHKTWNAIWVEIIHDEILFILHYFFYLAFLLRFLRIIQDFLSWCF